jgi:hypothetical protein
MAQCEKFHKRFFENNFHLISEEKSSKNERDEQ